MTVKNQQTKEVISICKGAPDVLIQLCANKALILESFMSTVQGFARRGIRCLALITTNHTFSGIGNDVLEGTEPVWEMVGVLTFLDPPRCDSAVTIQIVKELGVKVKMITGDHAEIAKETARVLGMVEGLDKENPCVRTQEDLLHVVEMSA